MHVNNYRDSGDSTPIKAVAESTIGQKRRSPSEFLNEYEIAYITTNLSLDDVNCFLIGEEHESPQYWNLNGTFIRAIGGVDAKVFIEGKPSGVEPIPIEKKEYCERHGLSNSIEMSGWDASEEVQNLIRTGPAPIEQNLIATRKEIEKILKERDESITQLHEMQSYGQIGDKAAGMIREVITTQTTHYEELCKKEQLLANALAKGMTESPIKLTFLERTKALVATLEKLRGETSKNFFIAGITHLQNTPTFSGPEYDLSTLYRELCHHKAAILIPKIYKQQIFGQKFLDHIKLPKGLELSEQQIADLSARLSSLSFNDEVKATAIVTEFLEPIINSYVLKSVLTIIDKMVLPEGLVLTEQQNADLCSKLCFAIINDKDIPNVISEFLEPIILSFFLNNLR